LRGGCYAEFWDSLDRDVLGTAIAASVLATAAAAVTVSGERFSVAGKQKVVNESNRPPRLSAMI